MTENVRRVPSPENQTAGSEAPFLLLYCRPGFEKETAAEIQALTAASEVQGYVHTQPGSGYVRFQPYADPDQRLDSIRYRDLIFARQLIVGRRVLTELPARDRIAPIVAAARELFPAYRQLLLETADTDQAKELSVFLRKFTAPMEKGCSAAGLLDATAALRLHLFFLDSGTVFLGTSSPGNSSPWPMGIPRLKFPRSAPSRSTLKLEEAFLHFLGADSPALQPGMTAVDLGAAPGGWTWQLVRRSIRVTAVDNGPMDPALLDSGIVHHLRADGFRYQPAKTVDWLVCDMVEQPSRVADLVARWLAEGHCRQAIFNLKLPMKKRYDEVKRCAGRITERLTTAGMIDHRLQFKQLYHDREEVTGWCCASGR
ncbi:MAG: 23S rRNA (cytidine(2498)-2'-O)-methyltransferase RlmM [Methylococcaceae bacterium]|nr:23S rRNA (cytidine(2498)-2'-O)-methyltransferase RlmM [Methylococcaceae bacterium]